MRFGDAVQEQQRPDHWRLPTERTSGVKSVAATDLGCPAGAEAVRVSTFLRSTRPITSIGSTGSDLTTTDVLVAGAGPAGLATAVTALRHGARVLVVERRPGTSTLPRATGISTRTMELFRAWGVADAVRAGSIDCDLRVAVTRTLADAPDELVPFNYPTVHEALAVSPAFPAVAPQDHIEPVLAAEVRRLGGEIRFSTPLVGLREVPDGVHAHLGRAGRPATAGVADVVRARFVVGADGPRSAVRAALGIDSEHLGTLGEFAQVLFRPDLAALLGRQMPGLSFVQHPDAEGVLQPVGRGRWTFARRWRPELGERPQDFTPERWTALLRTATGLPDLRPEFLDAQPFTMAAEVAAAFRAGPGFLVGDAANELGWRLAWAVRGLGGDALLDSYAVEREPVGRALAARSLREGREPSDGLVGDLGRTYRSAVIADDGDPAPMGVRTARPGERAPHVWVRWSDRRVSTLDLFENRLTLLTGGGGDGWHRAADRMPGTPVGVFAVGSDLPDPRGALGRAYRLGAGSAVLVRPDGIVSWRHDGPVVNHAAALSSAVGTALGWPARAAVAV
jgi:putative polyketide hydroxylase